MVDPTKGISASIPNSGGRKTGTELNDNLRGQHGSDVISGLGGDDVIWGDQVHDSGGAAARKQHDTLDGGAGNDTIYGGRGTNTIVGGAGDDYLQGSGVRSSIKGGDGNDTIKVTSGATTTVDGGAGDDTITAIIARGSAVVHCGAGVDTVIESQFAGNRKRVKIASDCEKRKRALAGGVVLRSSAVGGGSDRCLLTPRAGCAAGSGCLASSRRMTAKAQPADGVNRQRVSAGRGRRRVPLTPATRRSYAGAPVAPRQRRS